MKERKKGREGQKAFCCSDVNSETGRKSLKKEKKEKREKREKRELMLPFFLAKKPISVTEGTFEEQAQTRG